MKRFLIYILLSIALLTSILYIGYMFIHKAANAKPDDTVSVRDASAKYPYMYLFLGNTRINKLNAYSVDMSNDNLYDSLTVIGEDRNMGIEIVNNKLHIQGIDYEIRDMDTDALIDKGSISIDNNSEETIKYSIHIPNVLKEHNAYRLKLLMHSEEKELEFATKLMLDTTALIEDMTQLAIDFSHRNFDKELARENTMYIESDSSGDNSSLGEVDLKSNYRQLTYGNLDISEQGDKEVRIYAYEGNTSMIGISFMAESSDTEGRLKHYEIHENFVMRKGVERIHILDYTRYMNEIVEEPDISEEKDKIMIGIQSNIDIPIIKSPDNTKYAATINREIVYIDSKSSQLRKAYSARYESAEEDSGIKLLSLDNKGNIYFMEYGYMHIGNYEGSMGIEINKINGDSGEIDRLHYINLDATYVGIKDALSQCSYLNAAGNLYLYIDNKLIEMDINTGVYKYISNSIDYFVGSERGLIAWRNVDGQTIQLMNMDSGKIKKISKESGLELRPLGFIERDLVIGVYNANDVWNIHEVESDLLCSGIEILDEDLVTQDEYSEDESYIRDIKVDEDRVHLKLISAAGDMNIYKTDTIVYSGDENSTEGKMIDFYLTEEEEKQFYISLGETKLGNTKYTFLQTKLNDNGENYISSIEVSDREFYVVYGKGMLHYKCNIEDAINLAYDNMGGVWQHGNLLYARASLSPSRSLVSPQDMVAVIEADVSDGKYIRYLGIGLRQALYYVDKGSYVVSYDEVGNKYIIYGYDKHNITVYDIDAAISYKIEQKEAIEKFARGHNDYRVLELGEIDE